jgi:PKD domain-containing protein
LLGGQGDSSGSFSDVDGNSYLPPNGGPGGMGGPGQGPDHETLGGGPYNPNSVPPPPPHPTYANAIYYCSQNIVAEAQCSRSDDGGKTFGPGVPIFTPTQCTGGIHGHVKVAPDGTVYVPNSTCATTGNDGVAVSTDNGLTWTENNVTGSTGSQDPSVGVGQNNVGKPGTNLNGTNTIYLGWVSGDGHAHVAHSGNRGASWTGDTDVGAPFGITHAVFPVVVAGDDNRASFGFLGTGDGLPAGVCNPYGAVLNCQNIWHLYVATTYDGGANWITVDATPDDPVQKGTVCLEGTLCAGGRNLLDFNDITVDSQGRILVGYADGCVNCNNTFDTQSSANHGTVTRQSGGRRLFAFFDPFEPMPPAAPQMLSAIKQSPSGALVSWLEPDNGGAPITGYNIYRSITSGAETFLAHVNGVTTTKYFDPSPPSGPGVNVFYYAQAINDIPAEGPHCREVSLSLGNPETECIPPGLRKLEDPAGDTSATVIGLTNTPAPPGSDLLKFQISQPYQVDNIPRLIFTITTDNGQSPQAAGSAWYVAMKIGANYKAVRMAWKAASLPTPVFESYTPGANSGGGVDGRFVIAASEKAAEPTSSYLPPYNQIIIVVKASDLGLNPGDTISGFVSGSEQSSNPADPGVSPGGAALFDEMPNGLGYTGSYTVDNNQFCRLNNAPIPILTANPMTGEPPLAVNFDGSGSHDPDTAAPPDTIASYTFNFGDGSAPVTQASPLISHTYTTNGDFQARLTVTDSRGKVSTDFAQVTIGVETPLDKVVSRKIHGGVPGSPFNVILFDPANHPPPANYTEIECRAPGPENDYTIIYTFGTEFTVTGQATGVTVDGVNNYVGSHSPGPAYNQYTVHLTTSVPNSKRHVIAINGMRVHNSSTTANNGNATLSNVGTRFDLLIGDTGNDGTVSGADVTQTKREAGNLATQSNFREDVTADGSVSGADVTVVKRNAGNRLP